MIADLPIYRRDDIRGEYYVVFDKESIFKIAKKWARGNKYDAVNAHHRTPIMDGVSLFESYIIDQPCRDDHKERFPRQWLYYQMQQGESAAEQIGTPLSHWHKDAPEEINRDQIAELAILKFVTVEQLALASDGQLQRIGMGGVGLRERARQYLNRKNRSDASAELEDTKKQLAELQSQMAQLLGDAPKRRGRPPKEIAEA